MTATTRLPEQWPVSGYQALSLPISSSSFDKKREGSFLQMAPGFSHSTDFKPFTLLGKGGWGAAAAAQGQQPPVYSLKILPGGARGGRAMGFQVNHPLEIGQSQAFPKAE